MVAESVRLSALGEFSRALGSSLLPSELAGLAVEKALSGTGAEAGELFLIEESSGQSLLVCHRGLFPEAFRQLTRFPQGVGYPGLVASRREAIATDNLPQDQRYLRSQVKDLGFRSYFCLPLFQGERLLGCLNIATRHQGVISIADWEFLGALGGGLSLALGAGRWPLAELLTQRETERAGLTPEGIAHDALEAVARACGCTGAGLLFAPAPDGPHRFLTTWGAWREVPSPDLPPGCPARLAPRFSPCPEPGCPFGAGTTACYPLRWEGQPLGVLGLGYAEREALPVEVFSLLPGVAGLVATALGRLWSCSQAREEAAAEERHRLSLELHDGLVQSLGLLRVKADYLRRLAGQEPDRLAEELRVMRLLAGEAVEELRRTIAGLPPAELEREGLGASLKNLALRLGRAYQVPVRLRVQGTPEAVAPGVQLHLLRLAQEALSNALRHSGAKQVEVEVRLEASGCWLAVRDDGQGFDPERAQGGMGLPSMEARARSLGGRLTIDSGPGRGTALQVWLPAGR